MTFRAWSNRRLLSFPVSPLPCVRIFRLQHVSAYRIHTITAITMPTMDTAARTYLLAAHHDWDSIPAPKKSPGEVVSVAMFSTAAGGSPRVPHAVSPILTRLLPRVAGFVKK